MLAQKFEKSPVEKSEDYLEKVIETPIEEQVKETPDKVELSEMEKSKLSKSEIQKNKELNKELEKKKKEPKKKKKRVPGEVPTLKRLKERPKKMVKEKVLTEKQKLRLDKKNKALAKAELTNEYVKYLKAPKEIGYRLKDGGISKSKMKKMFKIHGISRVGNEVYSCIGKLAYENLIKILKKGMIVMHGEN